MLQSIVDALFSRFHDLTFPLGVLLGALLSILGTVLKKQLEHHASQFFLRSPAFIARHLGYRAFEKRYRQVIAHEHRYIRFVGVRQQLELTPPRLEDVYVDFELQAPAASSQAEYLRPALTLRDTFQIGGLIGRFQHAVLLGAPGSGKTTLLQHLVAVTAQPKKKPAADQRMLPIYVPLRRCALNGRSLVDELTDAKSGILPPELLRHYPKGFFEARLERHKCLLLFDGLDEVLDENRHVAAARLVDTCPVLYSKAHIIVTSRTAGWRGLLQGEFTRFVIRELSLNEIGRLINQWYVAVCLDRAKSQVLTYTPEIAARAREAAQAAAAGMLSVVRNSTGLLEIASTPLILSLMCLVYYGRHDLPEKRAQLYQECSFVLLRDWDQSDKQLSADVSLTIDGKVSLLERIAIALFRAGTTELSYDDLRSLLTTALAELKCTSAPEVVLRHIHERSGLLVEKAIGRYGFAHLTFQEYFTAVGLLKMPDGLAILLDVHRQRNAQEIALLYAGAAKNADNLLTALNAIYARTQEKEHILLAGRAVAESQNVSLQIKSTITNSLTQAFDESLKATLDATLDEQVLHEMQNVLQRLGVTRHIIRRFERYEIRGEIARGGFATVYAAFDTSLEREVALKVYHAGVTDDVKVMQHRMLQEIRALGSVHHPALVQIFDGGLAGERFFVVMELVQGSSLQELQRTLVEEFNSTTDAAAVTSKRRSGLPRLASTEYYQWARSFARDLVGGIAALHESGLLHGDLKPSNILVAQKELKGKITDFGLDARFANVDGISRTLRGPFTLLYAPPEVLNGNPRAASSDVYSLGMIFRELFLLTAATSAFNLPESLCGTSSLAGLSKERVREAIADHKGMITRAASVIETATDHDMKMRYQNVLELGNRLETALTR